MTDKKIPCPVWCTGQGAGRAGSRKRNNKWLGLGMEELEHTNYSMELGENQQFNTRSVLEAQCWHYLEWLGQSESHIEWLLSIFPDEDVVTLALCAKKRFELACLEYKLPGDTDETLTVQIQRERFLEGVNLDG